MLANETNHCYWHSLILLTFHLKNICRDQSEKVRNQVKHLPGVCTQLEWFPAQHRVPPALPEIIPHHWARSKPWALWDMAPNSALSSKKLCLGTRILIPFIHSDIPYSDSTPTASISFPPPIVPFWQTPFFFLDLGHMFTMVSVLMTLIYKLLRLSDIKMSKTFDRYSCGLCVTFCLPHHSLSFTPSVRSLTPTV